VKPLVAEISRVPLPAGFRLSTGFHAGRGGCRHPLDPEIMRGADGSLLAQPNSLTPAASGTRIAGDVQAHGVVGAEVRMPGRTPPSGAATVLFFMATLRCPAASRAVVRMPLPSV
jgi:hypothetical protein